MSMPQIPEEKNRPNLHEVTIDIFKSIALEETALSHILNAEGERSQAVIKKFENPCDSMSFEELNESLRQTEKILNTIIMKEWLLLRKLETAFEINQKMCIEPKPDKCKCKDSGRCKCNDPDICGCKEPDDCGGCRSYRVCDCTRRKNNRD